MKRPLEGHSRPFPQALESWQLNGGIQYSNDAVRCLVLVVEFEILFCHVEVVDDFTLQINEIQTRSFAKHDCHCQSSEELARFGTAVHIVLVVGYSESAR